MSNENINLRHLFDKSTRVTTLNELGRQGKNRVKVVNTNQIIEMISEAVNSVVERKAINIAEKERQHIIKESNDEFRKLLREREDERRKNDATQDRVDGYQREAEQARREADDLRRRLTEAELWQEKAKVLEESRSQDQETLRSASRELEEMRTEIERFRRREVEADALKDRIAELETRHADELSKQSTRADEEIRRLKLDLEDAVKSNSAETDEQIRCLKRDLDDVTRKADRETERATRFQEEADRHEEKCRDIQRKLDDAERKLADASDRSRSQVEDIERKASEFEDIASSQKELLTKYERRISSYEERIGSYERRIEELANELNEAREKDRASSGAFTSMVTELQSLKSAIAESQDNEAKSRAAAQEQTVLADKLQDLFSKKMEAIEQSLSMKLANIGSSSSAIDVAEPDLVLDRLFADNLTTESNLGTVEVKESQSGDIADQLARLKSLQGGALKGKEGSSEGEEG